MKIKQKKRKQDHGTNARALRIEAFLREYLVDRDPRRAAEAVGYAPASGSAILQRPQVRARLAVLAQRQVERADIRADEIMAELARIARSEVADIRASDKLKALELLARHFRLLEPEQGPITVAGAVQVIIQAAPLAPPPPALPTPPPALPAPAGPPSDPSEDP